MFQQTFYRKPEKISSKLSYHVPVADGGNRRREVKTTNSFGTQIQVPYPDEIKNTRKLRKVLFEPGTASESAIFWRDSTARRRPLNISLVRPRAIHRFVPHPIDPPIPKDAVVLGRWMRGQTIKLADRHYRIKELSQTNVKVIPENAVTVDIAKKLGVPKEDIKNEERALGKAEILKFFESAAEESRASSQASRV